MIKDDKGLYFIWFVWFVYLVNIIQEKSNDVGFFLIWSIMLLFMMLFVVKPIKEYQIRYQKYGRIPPFEHREKMKYITNFSRDKVIETLCQYQEAHGIFEYTFEMEKDGVFIFTINSIRQEYGYCGGKIKYRVTVTTEAEGCIIWFYLSESRSKSAETRYAWELKGFMEEKVCAVRVE